VGFQGIAQHREFRGSGCRKAVEEVIDLGGIDGEKSETGVQVLPLRSVSSL
jgi:hypothetical protein